MNTNSVSLACKQGIISTSDSQLHVLRLDQRSRAILKLASVSIGRVRDPALSQALVRLSQLAEQDSRTARPFSKRPSRGVSVTSGKARGHWVRKVNGSPRRAPARELELREPRAWGLGRGGVSPPRVQPAAAGAGGRAEPTGVSVLSQHPPAGPTHREGA